MEFPKIKLTKEALDRISQIVADVGMVLLATVILPAVLTGPNLPRIIIGSTLIILFWFLSIKISNKWIQ